MSWFLYVLECVDETLYTGICTDLARRVEEHNESPRGARYTRARRPVELAAAWEFEDRSAASKAEYAFKKLRRATKLAVLAGDAPDVAAELDLGERVPSTK